MYKAICCPSRFLFESCLLQSYSAGDHSYAQFHTFSFFSLVGFGSVMLLCYGSALFFLTPIQCSDVKTTWHRAPHVVTTPACLQDALTHAHKWGDSFLTFVVIA